MSKKFLNFEPVTVKTKNQYSFAFKVYAIIIKKNLTSVLRSSTPRYLISQDIRKAHKTSDWLIVNLFMVKVRIIRVSTKGTIQARSNGFNI